jgi:putative transcriptional regulator
MSEPTGSAASPPPGGADPIAVGVRRGGMSASSPPWAPIAGEGAVAELLADHARGRLPLPLATIAEAHAELSRRAARFLAVLDGLVGEALAAAPTAPIADRDRRLERIFAGSAQDPTTLDAEPVRSALPRAVARLVADAEEPWRPAWPGIRRRWLGRWENLTAELVAVAGGRWVPDHVHGGLEATLVIEGGFTDAGGAHGVGDLSILGAEDRHRPVADPEGCLCFAVFEGRGIRPTGRLARTVGRILEAVDRDRAR